MVQRKTRETARVARPAASPPASTPPSKRTGPHEPFGRAGLTGSRPPRFPFVGRERETAYIRSEVEAGRNVILTGPFGIGRTSIVENAARLMAETWLLATADCERPPVEVWRQLFGELFPKKRARPGTERKPMRWLRAAVMHRRPEDPRRHALLLDNLSRITTMRLDMVRRLSARFPVIAIVEAFAPEEGLAALRRALGARKILRIGSLGPAATKRFLVECSRLHDLGWGAGEIRGLARAVAGFPLGMRDLVAAEIHRRT